MEALPASCDFRDMQIDLRAIRKRLGLTLEGMAAKSGFSVSQLSRWEAGESNIPSERLPILAKAYECTIGEMFGEESPFELLGPTLYLKGEVAAGVWREAWEYEPDEWERFTGRADISAPLRERFGLRTIGESMNAVYPHGTILECVAFHGQHEIKNGKRVIVQRYAVADGIETTVKEYLRDGDGVEWLIPRSNNPAFQTPIRLDEPQPGIERIEIIGIVVASVRPE